MKKIYTSIYTSLILLAIILLIMYIKMENVDLKNIIGNIFAGIITGLIIAFLSNIKNRYIYNNSAKAKKYQELIDRSQNIIINQVNLQNKNEITIMELIDLYSEIYNNMNNYFQINEKNIKEGLTRLRYKTEKVGERIDKKLEELTEIMYEYSIPLEIYKKEYQYELAMFVTDIHMLQGYLKRDLNNILEDFERLSKSII